MQDPPRPEGIEAADDRFQQRLWRLQRAGWWAMALILTAALAGAFGNGPLSTARIDRDGVVLAYDRIVRASRDEVLTLAIADGRPARISLDQAWLDRVVLRDIRPTPVLGEARAGAQVLAFAAQPGATLTLRYEPLRAGLLRGRIEADGTAIDFTQIALP
jgi:hypothetical protein